MSDKFPIERRCYTLREFRLAGGPCRATVYELAAAGKLKLAKAGRRTLITAAEFDQYFADLPEFKPGQAAQA